MNEIEAMKADYDALNRGADKGQMSRGFTDFSMRATDLWVIGKNSGGKRGIIPATFPFEDATLSLEFWLVRGGARTRFQCWLMDKLAGATHVALFREMYPDGKCESQCDAGDAVEAGAGLTMSSTAVKTPPQKEAAPVKEVGVLALHSDHRRKSRKRKRSPTCSIRLTASVISRDLRPRVC